MRVHPVAELFPMLPAGELQALAADIAAHGQQQPIVMARSAAGDVLLDGRNRLAACKIAGVAPVFQEYAGDSQVAYIIGVNLLRRHLEIGQKIALGLAIEPYYAEEAKKRQDCKDLWIANARTGFCKGETQPCSVCGKYKSITHAHHIYPLAKQYDDGIKTACHDFVWLCPNHHTLIHWLMSDTLRAKMIHGQPFNKDDVASEEWITLAEITRMKTLTEKDEAAIKQLNTVEPPTGPLLLPAPPVPA